MTAPRTIRVVAAVLSRDGRYLITQRRPTAALPLLWEFPGGRVEPGESDSDALKREIRNLKRRERWTEILGVWEECYRKIEL